MTASAHNQPQPGLPTRLIDLCTELRQEGVEVGTAELLDAFAALDHVDWTREQNFRETLATCIAKDQEQRRIFDAVFERFMFRTSEEQALERDLTERHEEASSLELEDLNEAILQAVRSGSEGQMGDLARLAISAYGREGSGSGVIGMDLQRIRRALGLRGSAQTSQTQRGDEPSRAELQRFESHLRRELERAQIARTGKLPKTRPLAELDRALPSTPAQDLTSVHRVVSQLKRSLATLGHEARGRRRDSHVDIRHTMRASLQTGGVPLRLKYRPRRPRRPEIYVICDVSTSVSSASVFFLSVLHALHDSFRKLRSFVFVERVSEVTEIFERERNFKTISERISKEGQVADLSGYTDYGRVWLEFFGSTSDELDPRSTVIVLGDARTNGREPHAEIFARISERAGRTYWLNPEPKLYWNYGDSVMAAYEDYCTGTFECWSTKHLEQFVRVVARSS